MDKQINKASDLVFYPVAPFGVKMPLVLAGLWGVWFFGGAALIFTTTQLNRRK